MSLTVFRVGVACDSNGCCGDALGSFVDGGGWDSLSLSLALVDTFCPISTFSDFWSGGPASNRYWSVGSHLIISGFLRYRR